MFDADQVRLLMKAAVEADRHDTLPTDTQMQLNEFVCCDECAEEMIDYAINQAL